MQIDDLNIVLKVAEYRSITAAATQLDMRISTFYIFLNVLKSHAPVKNLTYAHVSFSVWHLLFVPTNYCFFG